MAVILCFELQQWTEISDKFLVNYVWQKIIYFLIKESC